MPLPLSKKPNQLLLCEANITFSSRVFGLKVSSLILFVCEGGGRYNVMYWVYPSVYFFTAGLE